MEISYYDTTPLISSDAAIAFVIAFLIIVECAKEPEYRCENCDKVYKQEARYKAHIGGCIVVGDTILEAPGLVRIVGDTIPVSAEDFSELLRQNREMMTMLRSQQETIQLLVDRLTAPAPKMNIE